MVTTSRHEIISFEILNVNLFVRLLICFVMSLMKQNQIYLIVFAVCGSAVNFILCRKTSLIKDKEINMKQNSVSIVSSVGTY